MSDAFYVIALLTGITVFLLWCLFLADGIVTQPHGLNVFQIRRNFMADVLTYHVSIAAPSDADVVMRELTVYHLDTDASSVTTFPAAAVDLGEINVPQGSRVAVEVVDVDDAGNRSTPARFEFVAADTLPPSQPGELSITLVRERESDEPTA
jgi:hypothetical protein